ncbi:MAG TPA: GTP-binding protein [Candidatus Aenigmarchaeota archaeon]|nr:MAG: GTP-binding protein [Candidatus Aenigmarchaeota archaeon]HDD46240.1 GTP-binding protein [Candidatus Aenigmarchaeota archaeon]
MKEDKLREIKEELRKTKYNKATQHHIALLRARLARLREERGTKSVRRGLRKVGDASVAIVGYPSVGKSTLLNALTNAYSKTGDYEFTTTEVTCGIMEYNKAKIQIFDAPGIIEGASMGRGKGKEILSFARMADLILILVDNPDQIKSIEKELHNSNFRLNKSAPKIKISKSYSGGINIIMPSNAGIDKKIVKEVLLKFKIYNADVVIEDNVAIEDVMDAIMGNCVYVPCIKVLNKIDKMSKEELAKARDVDVFISAKTGENIDVLKKAIWERLGLVRIYLKKIGKEPDMSSPLVFKGQPSVLNVAERIHSDIAENLRYARIWGTSAKFDGQIVGGSYLLSDGDIVELHFK